MSIVKVAEDGPWPLGKASAPLLEDHQNHPPPGALYGATNVLYTDDGIPFRRGGTARKSNADFGTGYLRWLWDGVLLAGQRTLFVDSGGDDLGILGTDDATPGTLLASPNVADPVSFAQIGGILFITAVDGVLAYAGSRETGSYSTGTVTVTNGSTAVTGAGTTWSTNVDSGMIFNPSAQSSYVVASVESNTALTLDRPFEGTTGAGVAYTAKVIETAVRPVAGAPSAIAGVGNRLVIAIGKRLYFSPVNDPMAQASNWLSDENRHDFPGTILGLATLRDTLVVFTTEGTYAIYNMSLDLSDAAGNPQQRVELISRELILWGAPGIAAWGGALLVPALDGLWVLDGTGAQRLPQPVSRELEWAATSSGLAPGFAAVHRGHLFLPVYDPDTPTLNQSSYVVKLTPNQQGLPFVHSVFSRSTARHAFAQRAPVTGDAPILLETDGLRVNTTSFFSQSVHTDADGTTPTVTIVTRNMPTGGGRKNYVSHVRVRHSNALAGTEVVVYLDDDSATLTAALVTGGGYVGTVLAVRRAANTVRVQIQTGATPINAGARLYGVEVFGRPSGRL